jgi:hypothetical protein
MKGFLKEKGHFVLAFFVLLIYLSPNIFFPEEARLLVHDNLDSNVVWYKNIANSPVLFGENTDKVEFTLNGLERGVFASEYNFIIWLYYWFSPINAYHLNIIFQSLIAFLGMYLFSKRYVFESDKKATYINVLIALGFAMLPFWPSGGAGVAGVPLLLFALLNIYNGEQNWLNWLWICFYPFYSSLIFSGLFIVVFLFMLFVVKMIKARKMNYLLILAFFTLTALYILIENRLFSFVILDGYESGRLGEGLKKVYNYKGIIGNAFRTLIWGQYHFHSIAYPIIMGVVIITIIAVKKARVKITKLFVVNYLLVVASIIFYWDKLAFLSENEVIAAFQFRWIAINPFLWYWLFSLSIKEWIHKKKIVVYLTYVVLISNILVLMFYVGNKNFYGSDFAENAFYHTYLGQSNEDFKTFSEFYNYEAFDEVKKIIPVKTKVVCLGVLPEVAQYHGYYTLGGYYSLYSTTHEKLVLAVLGKEKEKLKINSLGSKCYLNCLDLKEKKPIIENLEWDFEKLKELDYNYIFADRVINNKNLLRLESVKGSLLVYKIIVKK